MNFCGAQLRELGRLLFIAAGMVTLTFGQVTDQAPPKFDVVSIKPCKDSSTRAKGWGVGPARWSQDSMSLECQSLEKLIKFAYLWFPNGKPPAVSSQSGMKIPPASAQQMARPIEGGPAWVNSERFTINAKTDAPATREMMQGPMMQALLEGRFKLHIHRETRQFSVFNLTVAKGGPKLQPSKPGSCIPRNANRPADAGSPTVSCGAFHRSGRGSSLEERGVTMADFCHQLSAWLDKDVIDKTGLSGAFDIQLGLSLDELIGGAADGRVPADPKDGVSETVSDPSGLLMTAVRGLGLKLEAAKGPGEVLVIDQVQKPSEN